MRDPNEIQAEAMEAAEKAAQEHLEPFSVWPTDIEKWPPFPFPMIGDYDPPGWELIETHFVDSSGFGDPGEAALTTSQFKSKITVGHGYAITQIGQFQVYVGEFKKIRS